MIEVRKLGGPLGAEIVGLDPRLPVSAADLKIVEQAFLDNLVLRFRGAPLTPAQLRDFGRCFGELREHVAKDYRHPDFPEIVMMTNQDKDGNYDKVGAERGVGWHSDGTFEPVPPKATVLHAIAVPDSGGNTIFANMYLAYDTMPADLKRRVDGKMARFRLRGRKQYTQGIVRPEHEQHAVEHVRQVVGPHRRRVEEVAGDDLPEHDDREWNAYPGHGFTRPLGKGIDDFDDFVVGGRKIRHVCHQYTPRMWKFNVRDRYNSTGAIL